MSVPTIHMNRNTCTLAYNFYFGDKLLSILMKNITYLYLICHYRVKPKSNVVYMM